MLQDDLYKYPDVYVCLYDFFGCDSLGLEEDCMSSANSTEGGLTTATFNPGQDNEQRIVTEAKLTDEVCALDRDRLTSRQTTVVPATRRKGGEIWSAEGAG